MSANEEEKVSRYRVAVKVSLWPPCQASCRSSGQRVDLEVQIESTSLPSLDGIIGGNFR